MRMIVGLRLFNYHDFDNPYFDFVFIADKYENYYEPPQPLITQVFSRKPINAPIAGRNY